MALILSDRIKVSTTTTGTSTYTLGSAASGFETFTDNLSNGDTTYYCCTDGTDFEVGLGTFTSSTNKLSRTSIISSSNSNNAVSWSSGTRDIFCTLPGSKAVVLDANGALSTGITVQDEGSGLSTTATTLNFVGSGIVASGTGATKTITVTGGGIGTSAANYFDAHTSSDSSALTSSFATIDFDTIRYNSNGSIFSESAGEVTMTTTGIHRFHADVTTKITSGSSRSDCEIELQRKPSGGSFSQVAGSTAITYNRTSGRGEQTASIDILYNVTSGDAYRVVVKRQGGTDTIVVQGGAARFNISSVGANPTVATTALDDITAGDAATTLTTTTGDLTFHTQGNNNDIIFKGNDGGVEKIAGFFDMSASGKLNLNEGFHVEDNGNVTLDVGVDIIFEGDTANGNETTLYVVNPTADRTVLLPNASGTVITTGNLSDITSTGTLTSLTVDDITINGSTISDGADLTIDVGGDIILDANGADVKFKDNGTEFLRIRNESNDAVIRPVVDAKDLIFQQRDGTEVARVEDNGTFNVVTDKLAINGTAITSTAAELNILDGVTSTTAELNILDGVTSTAAELNILDGVTSTASELNILDGVTATTAELNILDGVTSTTAELNILDGVTSTAAELNILDGVTSTTAELNILDGVTSTTAELNIMDGNTSASSTTLVDADRLVTNDNGTMKQVALSDVKTYLNSAGFSSEDPTALAIALG